MPEKIKFDLDKDSDEERQFQEDLGAHAAPFFVEFVRECDKRYSRRAGPVAPPTAGRWR